MATNATYKRTSRRRKTQHKNSKWILLVIIAAIVVWILYGIFQKQSTPDGRYRYMKAFGIKIPLGYKIHGVDLSYFQENISWGKLRSANDEGIKIGFVFIKATEGITRHDLQFQSNWEKAKASGIPRGAYHYFIASRDGSLQAKNFIQHVQLQKGDLPPVLDIEHIPHSVSHAEMRKEVKSWLETIENAYHVKPIIYTFVSFYNDYLGKDFDQYPLWIAQYGKMSWPVINRSWTFWQHNEKGKIKGMSGHFDFDVFNGDSSDFNAIKL